MSWPLTAPAGNSTVWVSAKKPSTLDSSLAMVKPVPVSAKHQYSRSHIHTAVPAGGQPTKSRKREKGDSPPSVPFKPVRKGPCRQPKDARHEKTSRPLTRSRGTGLGKARRGGPARPTAASWMWVAVAAGDW